MLWPLLIISVTASDENTETQTHRHMQTIRAPKLILPIFLRGCIYLDSSKKRCTELTACFVALEEDLELLVIAGAKYLWKQTPRNRYKYLSSK